MKLKNWIRRSFRNRVFATILVVTLVPLLLCDVVMMQVIVARAEHTQARQARAALDMLSQRFDEAAGQCGDTLEALATSTITRSVLRRTEPDSRLLYQFLYLSAAAVRSYADLEIYDAQGACLYSTDASLAAAPADTDWGGLYAAVSSVLSARMPRRVVGLTLPDAPVPAGSSAEVFRFLGLDADGIFETARRALEE